MALYGSVGDGRRLRLNSVSGAVAGQASAQPLYIDTQDVTFTGTGTVKFPELDTVVAVHITLKVGTAPGLNPAVFTYTINGNVVSLFSWQPTSNANPTLVAGTSATTVNVLAIGVRRYGQSA